MPSAMAGRPGPRPRARTRPSPGPAGPRARRCDDAGSSSTKPARSWPAARSDVGDDLPVTTGAEHEDPSRHFPSSVRAEPVNSGMVACPSREIPDRWNTLATVIARIFRSSPRVQLSTYHASRANFSSQEMAFRPFTWAQPVIPGSTSWRRACSREYRGRYCTRSGRGPTSDRSPRRTFQIWGSSSMLVARRSRPSPGEPIGVGEWLAVRPHRVAHGPELHQPEEPPLSPGALLRKQHRRAEGGPDRRAARRRSGPRTRTPVAASNQSIVTLTARGKPDCAVGRADTGVTRPGRKQGPALRRAGPGSGRGARRSQSPRRSRGSRAPDLSPPSPAGAMGLWRAAPSGSPSRARCRPRAGGRSLPPRSRPRCR